MSPTKRISGCFYTTKSKTLSNVDFIYILKSPITKLFSKPSLLF